MNKLGKNVGKLLSSFDLTSEFTGSIENQWLVLVEEMSNPNSTAIANHLKNLITDEIVRVRKMFQDPKYEDSFVKMIFISNNDTITKGEKHMRRFFMLMARDTIAYKKDFLKKFFQKSGLPINVDTSSRSWLNSEFVRIMILGLYENDFAGLKTLFNFFYNLPIENLDIRNHVELMTEPRMTHILQSLTIVQRYCFDLLRRGYNCEMIVNGLPRCSWKTEMNVMILYEEFRRLYGSTSKTDKFKGNAGINVDNFIIEIQNMFPKISVGSIRDGGRIFQDFPTLNEAIKYFDEFIPGIAELLKGETIIDNTNVDPLGVSNDMESEENVIKVVSTTSNEKRIERFQKFLDTPLAFKDKFLPTHFFGYPLMFHIQKKSFKILSNEEYFNIRWKNANSKNKKHNFGPAAVEDFWKADLNGVSNADMETQPTTPPTSPQPNLDLNALCCGVCFKPQRISLADVKCALCIAPVCDECIISGKDACIIHQECTVSFCVTHKLTPHEPGQYNPVFATHNYIVEEIGDDPIDLSMTFPNPPITIRDPTFIIEDIPEIIRDLDLAEDSNACRSCGRSKKDFELANQGEFHHFQTCCRCKTHTCGSRICQDFLACNTCAFVWCPQCFSSDAVAGKNCTKCRAPLCSKCHYVDEGKCILCKEILDVEPNKNKKRKTN